MEASVAGVGVAHFAVAGTAMTPLMGTGEDRARYIDVAFFGGGGSVVGIGSGRGTSTEDAGAMFFETRGPFV